MAAQGFILCSHPDDNLQVCWGYLQTAVQHPGVGLVLVCYRQHQPSLSLLPPQTLHNQLLIRLGLNIGQHQWSSWPRKSNEPWISFLCLLAALDYVCSASSGELAPLSVLSDPLIVSFQPCMLCSWCVFQDTEQCFLSSLSHFPCEKVLRIIKALPYIK